MTHDCMTWNLVGRWLYWVVKNDSLLTWILDWRKPVLYNDRFECIKVLIKWYVFVKHNLRLMEIIRWGTKWRRAPFIYTLWPKRRSSTVKRSLWATIWRMPCLVPTKAVPTWKTETAAGRVWPPPIHLTCQASKLTEGVGEGGPILLLPQKHLHLRHQFKSLTFQVQLFPLCLWHLLRRLRRRLLQLNESNVPLRSWSCRQYLTQEKILLMDLQVSMMLTVTHQPNKNTLRKTREKW